MRCAKFGVVVFKESMLDCRGSICHEYMCIVLYIYMKVIWFNGFPQIYAQLDEGWGQSAMGMCALCYIGNLFGVIFLQRSMLNWRRVVNLP